MLEKAIMYNKHTPLLSVDIENGHVKRILQCIDDEHLPIILQDNLTEETLNEWLGKRKLPEKREGYSLVRRYFPGIEMSRNMFSLSDQYWFRFRKNETWDCLNFFTNPYSEDVGIAFFTPWKFEAGHRFQQSPDQMTNGALRKRWTRNGDGTSYLIKAGSSTLHQEPITEVLASIIIKKLDIIPYVEYELVVDGMKLCSRCRNFVDAKTEFVPAAHIYYKKRRRKTESVYDHLLHMCAVYGIENAQDYVDGMIAVDHIIGNDDRHLGNFGFIRDVETAKITGFAPLFDSGSSYGVINGTTGSSKFFHDREKSALRRYIRKININKLKDHDEAYCLIDTYPEITKSQVESLKMFIEEMESELNEAYILEQNIDEAAL